MCSAPSKALLSEKTSKDVNCEQSCVCILKAFLGAKTFKDVNCELRRKLLQNATYTGALEPAA